MYPADRLIEEIEFALWEAIMVTPNSVKGMKGFSLFAEDKAKILNGNAKRLLQM